MGGAPLALKVGEAAVDGEAGSFQNPEKSRNVSRLWPPVCEA